MPLGPETKNRFAGLKIDDDDDDCISSKESSGNQNQSSAAASKRKNKKKNKESDEALRNMAFGSRPTSSRQQKRAGGSASQPQRSLNNKPLGTEEWAEWQRRDEEATNDMYEQDLQRAILESRLEAEQKEAHRQAEKEGQELTKGSAMGGKKKKKKDKPQAMSLDQFNQLPPETIPGSDDENEDPIPAPVQARVPVACQDKQYFESVMSDATRILQKERIQEQYQKAYAHESAMQSKYQEEIEKLRKKITELESCLEEQAKELKKVKERNARLCKILADGEMKEKTAILMQVEELTSDKEHLTEQLASLTAELEKERSKNHTLKQENDKLKGKHGK